jgi:hypothetical protein
VTKNHLAARILSARSRKTGVILRPIHKKGEFHRLARVGILLKTCSKPILKDGRHDRYVITTVRIATAPARSCFWLHRASVEASQCQESPRSGHCPNCSPASPVRGFASRMHHHRIWVSGVFAYREVGSTVIGSSPPSIVATVVAQGLKLPPNYSATDCVQQNV